MINFTVNVLGGDTNTLGSAGCNVTFNGTYRGGQLSDGTYYVVAPNGIKHASHSPAVATEGSGRKINGIQVAGDLSSDVSALDGAAFLGWTDARALTTDKIVLAGEAIIKVKGEPGIPLVNTPRTGLLADTTVIHVVASAKAANLRAPMTWPSNNLGNKPWRAADPENFLAGLPTYAYVPSAPPSWASIAPNLDKVDLWKPAFSGLEYQYLTPAGITPTGTYGEYRLDYWGLVWSGILGQVWSSRDKVAAVNRIMSNGCQIAESRVGCNLTERVDGGHQGIFQTFCLAWLKGSGQVSRYAEVMAKVGANLTGQYYQVTTGLFNRHTSPDLPYSSRERLVTDITGSAGNWTVYVTSYDVVGGHELSNNTNFDYGYLTRVVGGVDVSDAVIANSANRANSGDPHPLEMVALPTGLVIGDTVWVRSPNVIPVGQWDFAINGADPMTYQQNIYSSAYRTNNPHGNALLPIAAMGMMGADLFPCKSYVEWMSIFDSSIVYNSGFQHDFFMAHQATILALPQIV